MIVNTVGLAVMLAGWLLVPGLYALAGDASTQRKVYVTVEFVKKKNRKRSFTVPIFVEPVADFCCHDHWWNCLLHFSVLKHASWGFVRMVSDGSNSHGMSDMRAFLFSLSLSLLGATSSLGLSELVCHS